jgi:hypothetical protein
MVRELDFSDGFESSTPPVTSMPTVITGSSSVPVSITAGGGITAAAAVAEDQFVKGIGGVTVTANPQISAGTYNGQVLNLIGTSDTNWVSLANGNGLRLNGPCTLTDGKVLSLRWDSVAALWGERFENGMA